MNQSKQQCAQSEGERDLVKVLHAAVVCGCPACRHVARMRIVEEHAHQAFARAFEDLAETKDLPWLLRKRAA